MLTRICRTGFLLGAFASAPAAAQMPAGFTVDPAEVRIETGDVRRLARAIGLGGRKGADVDAVLEREYFGHASPGLRAWTERYGVTPASLAAAIRAHPAAYADMDGAADAVHAREPEFRAAFMRLRELFPGAVFPPVWFIVGDHGAGGLARPEGVLIAAERFAADPDGMVPLVMHELAHFQAGMLQGIDVYRRLFGPEQTLLGLALREGSADFIAELTTGRHTNPAAEAFGLRHERELWLRFREEMSRREPGDWMWVRPATPDWPPDLGYWMGYRIVKSYYENAENRQRAIHDILNLTDFRGFLEASGYAARMEP